MARCAEVPLGGDTASGYDCSRDVVGHIHLASSADMVDEHAPDGRNHSEDSYKLAEGSHTTAADSPTAFPPIEKPNSYPQLETHSSGFLPT